MTALPVPARPLAGLRVVDLTHVIAGPFAAHQLAALGADVVKVERPGSPDMARFMGAGASDAMGAVYRAQGAGKTAISLDLATPDGIAGLHLLLADADVLIENHRAGALERLGLGYEALKAKYPRLIYCSITGFGHDGPRRGWPAYDNVIQASSGLMSLNGKRIGAPVIDYATGLTAALAIMAALAQRASDGLGQHVDVALTLAGAAVLRVTENSDAAEPRPAVGADGHPGLGCYETSDGLVMLGALNDRQLARLAKLLNAPSDLLDRGSLAREGGHASARRFLEYELSVGSAAEWEARLNAAGIPAQRVRTMAEAASDAIASGRDLLAPVDDGAGRAPAAGFRLSRARIGHDRPAPRPGAEDGERLGSHWQRWNAACLQTRNTNLKG